MKAVKRKDLIVGETYYDTDNELKEALLYKGEENGVIYFLPLKETTPYMKTSNTKFEGCIDFVDEGSPFYQEE